MEDKQFAEMALQMVEACNIQASSAEQVVAIKNWLKEIASGQRVTLPAGEAN